LHTEIEIDAAPEVVWQVLTDFERYTEWNPFMTSAAGRPEVGEKLVVRLEPPGGRPVVFKPQVTAVENSKVLEWLGILGFSGLFDGRHRFEMERSRVGTTKFAQSESFDGIFVGALRRSLDIKTKEGFEAMNVALKARAESTVPD